MTWLRKQPEELLDHFLRFTECPLLVSLPDGRCLWANEAFTNRMKYTESELVGYTKPNGDKVDGVTWDTFTVPDENLDADIQAVRELEAGERTSYRCKKQYIPKDSAPEDVIIQVLRYPSLGEFQCCLVTVTFVDGIMEVNLATALSEITASVTRLAMEMSKHQEETNKKFIDVIETMNKHHAPTSSLQKGVGNLAEWADQNRWAAFIVLLLLIALLGGISEARQMLSFFSGVGGGE